MTEDRTRRAIEECGRWLAECIRMGWRREDLDMLEGLWWKYHNHRGELISDVGEQKERP
jgi:hypothetical protein